MAYGNANDTQIIMFASDNYAGAHPNVLAKMADINDGFARPYNSDDITAQVQVRLEELIGKPVGFFPTLNGTGTNVLALRAALPRWGSVVSPETAHINTDECAAPENMAGIKSVTVKTSNGKLVPDDISRAAREIGNIHSPQPLGVSISNTTEIGTVYTPEQVRALADTAHAHNMFLHIDGARIFNALTTTSAPSPKVPNVTRTQYPISRESAREDGEAGFDSQDLSIEQQVPVTSTLRQMLGESGVDIVSFGGTKVGAASAEAVLVLNQDLMENTKYSQKQMGQLGSKARYASAQFAALLEPTAHAPYLAIELRVHANQLATLLYQKVAAAGVTVAAPQANALFPTFTRQQAEVLRSKYHFYTTEINDAKGLEVVRLMTSWCTTEDDVQELAEFIGTLV